MAAGQRQDDVVHLPGGRRQERPRHRHRRRRRHGHHDEGDHGRARPAPPADTTAPDTTITLGPDRHHHRQHADVRVHRRARAGRRSSASSTAGAWATLHQPVDDERPWPTARTASSVRATDAAGNTDATPATRSFTVEHDAAGRHHRARHHDWFGPDRTHQRQHADLRVHRRARAGRRSSAASTAASWATLHQPVDDDRAGRRRAQRRRSARPTPRATPTPRPRRARSPSTRRPRTPRSTRRRPSLSPGSSATVTFSASESGATFECRLDGGAWAGVHVAQDLHRPQPRPSTRSTSARPTRRATSTASPATASWTSIALTGGGSGTPAAADPVPEDPVPVRTRGADGDALRAGRRRDVHLDAEHGRRGQRQPRREPGRVLVRRGARVPRHRRPLHGHVHRRAGRRPTACTPSPSGPSTPPGNARSAAVTVTRVGRRHAAPGRAASASVRARAASRL